MGNQWKRAYRREAATGNRGLSDAKDEEEKRERNKKVLETTVL